MKDIEWIGRAYDDLFAFPNDARQEAGYQLHLVQTGDDPTDWKPMKSIGQGVKKFVLMKAAHIVLSMWQNLKMQYMCFMPSRRRHKKRLKKILI